MGFIPERLLMMMMMMITLLNFSNPIADPRPYTGDSNAASQLRLELIIEPTENLLMCTVVNNKLIII